MSDDIYTRHLERMAEVLDRAGLDPARAGDLDAALDILTDDGVSLKHAMEMMVTALRASDRPLEGQARHIVELRRAVR